MLHVCVAACIAALSYYGMWNNLIALKQFTHYYEARKLSRSHIKAVSLKYIGTALLCALSLMFAGSFIVLSIFSGVTFK